MSYSNEDYFNMLMCLGKSDCNYSKARKYYKDLYADPKNIELPSRMTFQRLHLRVSKTGCVHGYDEHRAKAGRPKLQDIELEKKVLQLFSEDPSLSTRSVARDLGVNHMRVWKILRDQDDSIDQLLGTIENNTLLQLHKVAQTENNELQYIVK